jgi:hypothetical protein
LAAVKIRQNLCFTCGFDTYDFTGSQAASCVHLASKFPL